MSEKEKEVRVEEESRIKKPTFYTTFSKKIDELLVSGYKTSSLLHIYGDPKTGKTTLSTYIPMISIIKKKKELKPNETFLVISTDGGFSFERLEELCKVHEVDFNTIVEHLAIAEPDTFMQQYYVVTKSLLRTIEERAITPLLVVLDPATVLYRAEYRDVPQKEVLLKARELKPRLESQLFTLLKIAKKYDCLAIVTNIRRQFLGMSEEDRKKRWDFYAGNLFAYVPYATIRLSRVEKTSEDVVVERIIHRYAWYKRAVVRLTEKGFENGE